MWAEQVEGPCKYFTHLYYEQHGNVWKYGKVERIVPGPPINPPPKCDNYYSTCFIAHLPILLAINPLKMANTWLFSNLNRWLRLCSLRKPTEGDPGYWGFGWSQRVHVQFTCTHQACMCAEMLTYVHTNTQGNKDMKTEGSPGIWKRARSTLHWSVIRHPNRGQPGPPGPSGHQDWAHSQPGRWGVSLIVPLVACPAEETVLASATK